MIACLYTTYVCKYVQLRVEVYVCGRVYSRVYTSVCLEAEAVCAWMETCVSVSSELSGPLSVNKLPPFTSLHPHTHTPTHPEPSFSTREDCDREAGVSAGCLVSLD